MTRSKAELEALWTTVGESGAPAGAFTESICPDTLPALRLPRRPPAAIELRGELGRGGMGVVHRGYQVSLRREVAVKVVAASHASPDQRTAVREALVAAHLEHPNIVPIYTVEEGENGEPLIVMKRIEGVPWSECIEDPTRAPRMKRDDPLGWHLDVFLAVCRAAQFAHDRGFLHRDIKPDNVLIGGHGDVYLMDWGLAVALDPGLEARAPLASQVSRIAGTPGYMAPEMIRGHGAALGRASDVHLLGATLHEVLTGAPRFVGANVGEILHATLGAEPYEYGPDVPVELAAICAMATHEDPARRHPSAAALGAAVRGFLEKRPALGFLAEGRALLERLRERLAASEQDEVTLAAIDETAGGCRSAFDEALRRWPENDRVVAARDDAYAVMAAHEMGRGNLDDAAALIDGMAQPPPDLRARLETLRTEEHDREREYARLKKLEREVDAGLGGRSKAVIVTIFGLAVFAHNVTYGRLRAAGAVSDSNELFMVGPILLIAGLAALGFLWRRGTFRNLASRQVLFVLVSLGAAVLGIRTIGAVHGIPPHETYGYVAGIYVFGAAQIASMADRRIYASALVLGVAAVAAVVWPSWTFELIGTSVLLATLVMAAVWWQRGSPSA